MFYVLEYLLSSVHAVDKYDIVSIAVGGEERVTGHFVRHRGAWCRINPVLYFGYGANTNHQQMARRCPGAVFIGTASLPNHRLVFRGVADVIKTPGYRVTGALWEINRAHLAALDRFEGYPNLYTRGQRAVAANSDRRPRATVYWMNQGHALAVPYESYLGALIDGYLDCGLPREQLEDACRYSAVNGSDEPYRSRQWRAA